MQNHPSRTRLELTFSHAVKMQNNASFFTLCAFLPAKSEIWYFFRISGTQILPWWLGSDGRRRLFRFSAKILVKKPETGIQAGTGTGNFFSIFILYDHHGSKILLWAKIYSTQQFVSLQYQFLIFSNHGQLQKSINIQAQDEVTSLWQQQRF